MKILFFGIDDNVGLCPSYLRAAKNLGIEYQLFDYQKALYKNIPYGKFGLLLHEYFGLQNWIHRINREFVLIARSFQPNYIFSITNAPITPAAIMFLKTVLPETKFVMIWPDSILNFSSQSFASLGLYDLIATYGSASVKILSSVSKTQVVFVPLAADPDMHNVMPSKTYQNDIGFVGGWRPERQKLLEAITDHFPSLRLEVHGPIWKKVVKNSKLKPVVKSEGLRGKAMAEFFNTTRINMNIIDETNYPSANMRFFEILTAGGLELVSSCPEMEEIFIDKEDLVYFHNEQEMLDSISWVLNNGEKIDQIKLNGHNKTNEKHTYTDRLKTIIKSLS